MASSLSGSIVKEQETQFILEFHFYFWTISRLNVLPALSTILNPFPEDIYSTDIPTTKTTLCISYNSTKVRTNTVVTDATIIGPHLDWICSWPSVRLTESLFDLLKSEFALKLF
jgi:hypothetical protein